MIVLLQSRRKMKIQEIANELGVSQKQVRNYRNNLYEAGIYIESEQGPYGGYKLLNNNNLLGLNLSVDEISVIDIVLEQLKYNDYMYTKEFQYIVDKIKAVTNIKNDSSKNMNYFIKEAKASLEEDKQKIKDINIAVITRKKVYMKYYSLNSGLNERIIHPYGLYQYKGDMYLAAYCEKRKNIIDFKICRIKEYHVLDTKFKIQNNFSWKEYMKNCIGIYKDREEIELELKIKYPLSYIVSEKIWVDNQEIIENEDKSIIFKAKMRGITEIKSWILSMGSSVEVIKPKSLRDEIKEEVKEIQEIY
ncbi:helix-turn-helix transcriptional regulator [Tepidibacter thalassicus]|nr:WYL domain-containing transcriptional regulator [Tepidibacter thalassicus]